MSLTTSSASGINGNKTRALRSRSFATTGSPTVSVLVHQGIPYDIITFTGSGSITPSVNVNVVVLVVGGGGGGGAWGGAGGGGGGVVPGGLRLFATATYTVTIGAGGVRGQNTGETVTTLAARGGTSSIAAPILSTTQTFHRPGGVIAYGGGPGAHWNAGIASTSDQAAAGGSTPYSTGGTGSALFGYGGGSGYGSGNYTAGGGGSSIAAGGNGNYSWPGAGAHGYTWINSTTYGGGGGGASYYTAGGGGGGGMGGGGSGIVVNSGGTATATSGGANTGGGGGGGSYYPPNWGNANGGTGGSGVVIVAIPRFG